MVGTPDTQPTLLARLRDSRDDAAWSQFVAVYAPLVQHYLRSRHLQEADAADLTQDVLASVAVAMRSFEYARQKGSFRGWLFTIVLNRLRNFQRDTHRRPRAIGGSTAVAALNAQPDGHDDGSQWDLLYEQRLFQHAAELVRGRFHASTWQAFWQTAVAGRPTADVAAELGITPAAVYLARGRVIKRIQEQVRLLSEESP